MGGRASDVRAYEAGSWFPDFERPREHPAYKAHLHNEDVYIKQADVRYIVDLTDDSFPPVGPTSGGSKGEGP